MYWNREHDFAVSEIDAISWAAKKSGVSYGTFVSEMKKEQYMEIMEEFCAEMVRRKKEEQARLRRAEKKAAARGNDAFFFGKKRLSSEE